MEYTILYIKLAVYTPWVKKITIPLQCRWLNWLNPVRFNNFCSIFPRHFGLNDTFYPKYWNRIMFDKFSQDRGNYFFFDSGGQGIMIYSGQYDRYQKILTKCTCARLVDAVPKFALKNKQYSTIHMNWIVSITTE